MSITRQTRSILQALAIPPMMLGSPPPLDTVRQRADYIAAMAQPMGLDPIEVAELDPAAQQLLFNDRLRLLGVL